MEMLVLLVEIKLEEEVVEVLTIVEILVLEIMAHAGVEALEVEELELVLHLQQLLGQVKVETHLVVLVHLVVWVILMVITMEM
jgi:hypothetical protein